MCVCSPVIDTFAAPFRRSVEDTLLNSFRLSDIRLLVLIEGIPHSQEKESRGFSRPLSVVNELIVIKGRGRVVLSLNVILSRIASIRLLALSSAPSLPFASEHVRDTQQSLSFNDGHYH